MTDSFITKYRPTEWGAFIGNEPVITTLKNTLDARRSHAFLLHGGSGFGKTTLARLAASHLGAKEQNIREIDGATYTGIDAMREVTEGLKYRPFSAGSKVIIIDEAQALSRPAIQSVLKVIEEPPEWLFWFLCTTNVARIPETIRTRCTILELKPLSTSQLSKLLDAVAYAEEIEVPAPVIDLCANEAYGSARQALAYLGQTLHCKTREEASAAIGRYMVETDKVFALALALWNRDRWDVVAKLLAEVKDEDPESIRHRVRALATTNILKGNEKIAADYMPLLDEFLVPMDRVNGISPIIVACARWLFR